jgi:hypothetical protein
MKKFYLLLLFSIVFFNDNYSQENSTKNSNTRPQGNITSREVSKMQDRNLATAYLKDTIIVINGLSFDYRVLKYYDENALKRLSPVKLKQIYFLYTESYTIPDLGQCPALKLKDIDIVSIEIERKEETETTVEYGKDCKVHITLIPRKLVTQTFEDLKN